MNPVLTELIEKYPPLKNWGEISVFTDTLELENLKLLMAGLSFEGNLAIPAIGSAVGINEFAIARAYFELLERAYLIEIEQKGLADPFMRFSVLDSTGGLLAYSNSVRLFKVSSEQDIWKYSKSNGVAVHTSFSTAAHNAAFELLERDRILRFWYSQRAPQSINHILPTMPNSLREIIDFRMVHFNEADDTSNGIFIVGIFGFPKRPGVPFVTGFGAGSNIDVAIAKSSSEMIQQLAFLWGEKMETTNLQFQTTGDYHLEFNQQDSAQVYIKNWLDGNLPIKALNFNPALIKDIYYVDLNQTHRTGSNDIFLVKAISDQVIPLTFGCGNPKVPFLVKGREGIHPIS